MHGQQNVKKEQQGLSIKSVTYGCKYEVRIDGWCNFRKSRVVTKHSQSGWPKETK
jgi:hypothetical protein